MARLTGFVSKQKWHLSWGGGDLSKQRLLNKDEEQSRELGAAGR